MNQAPGQGVVTARNVNHEFVATANRLRIDGTLQLPPQQKLALLATTIRNLGDRVQFRNNNKFNKLSEAIAHVNGNFNVIEFGK